MSFESMLRDAHVDRRRRFSSLSNDLRPVSDDDIEAFLDLVRGVMLPSRDDEPRLSSLADDVCREHGITRLQLRSERRFKPWAYARHDYCYRACVQTSRSLPAIGRVIGYRDHTSVMYGANAHARRNGLPCDEFGLRRPGQ